jgi:uncharacterized MAPEG superfamily protein
VDISIWCTFVAFMLIYAPRMAAIRGAIAQEGRYDLAEPRLQQARLTGRGGRAQAAHLNSIEAFAPFAAAVWVAHYAGSDPLLRDTLAVVFVVARGLYILAYLADLNPWRTVAWTVGIFAVIGLFVSPLL